jgi:hypothetical protein
MVILRGSSIFKKWGLVPGNWGGLSPSEGVDADMVEWVSSLENELLQKKQALVPDSCGFLLCHVNSALSSTIVIHQDTALNRAEK